VHLHTMTTSAPTNAEEERGLRALALLLLGPHESRQEARPRPLEPEEQKERTAIHEAGHAVVCIGVGGPFSRVKVNDGPGCYDMKAPPTGFAGAAVDLAGPMAELITFGNVNEWRGRIDLQNAVDHSRSSYISRAPGQRAREILESRKKSLRAV